MEEWQPALLDCEEREEFVIVVRAVEDHATVIAARDDVIETTFNFNSWFSGHRWRGFYSSRLTEVNRIANRRPDPVLLIRFDP